jgi:hypothetical protein
VNLSGVALQVRRVVTVKVDFGHGAIDDQETHSTVRRQWYANQLTERRASASAPSNGAEVFRNEANEGTRTSAKQQRRG